MSQYITEVTDQNFQSEVITASLPVLVDFWAPWCGPCRMVAPILEKLAVEYKDKLKIAKVNVDDNPETAGKFSVSAIPTMLIFKNGAVQEQIVGFQSAEQLQQTIGKIL